MLFLELRKLLKFIYLENAMLNETRNLISLFSDSKTFIKVYII